MKKIATMVLVAAILITTATPVFAWKAKTHSYIANLILEDVADGKLNISPVGEFSVDPEFAKALREYPAAYRAGSLGPDAYPDIYIGQTYIHPKEGLTSGQWLRLICQDAMKMPQNDPKRYEAMAFILGFMTHYAGDMFGHNYINQIAGGAYPAMTDLLDPDKSEAALTVILKHIGSESLIDSKIPAKYKTGTYVDVNAPNDFVLNSMVYDGDKNSGISRKYVNNDIPYHLKYMVELRNTLYQKAEYWRSYENAKNAADYAENTLMVNYVDRWIADLDNAMAAWIQVSENIAKGMINDADEGDLTVVRNEMTNWFDKYGKYMSPAPDAIVDALGAPETFAKFLKERFGIDYLYDMYEKFKGQVQGMILDYMIYNVAGMTEEQVQQMRDALSMPNLVLSQQELATMEKAMKNFGEDVSADQHEFTPFYNSLVMTKLILIGPDNYNALLRRYSGSAASTYTKSTAAPAANSLDVTIKTNGDTEWNYTTVFGKKIKTTPKLDQPGTDDDIFFGVKFKDGTSVEQLFDKSGYNDFEKGDRDTYKINLNKNARVSEISGVYLRKSSTNLPSPDWKVDYMEISAYNGSTKIADLGKITINAWIKGSTTKPFSVNRSDSTYQTSLNTGIIDFMESLDDSLQWENQAFSLYSNPVLKAEVFDKIFKDAYNVEIFTEEAAEDDTAVPADAADPETITYVSASSWAIPELKQAVANGLVKDLSLFDDCSKGISRKEFAALMVGLYEAMTGKAASASSINTFTDTTDSHVLKANNLGIVTGIGGGLFAPDSLIPREQMAVMFYRAIDRAHIDAGKASPVYESQVNVKDKAKISNYAVKYIGYIFNEEIITGDGISFNPKGTATREAAIAVVNRVFVKYGARYDT